MTDFTFLSSDGAVNVTQRTDLIAAVPSSENLTICQHVVNADPNKLFVNMQRNKTTVLDLKAFATANNLRLVSQTVGGQFPFPAPNTLVDIVLAAPTGVGAVVNSATQITVNWTKSTRATGYIVERATNVGFTTGVVAFTVGDVATKAVTGLTTGTQYWFRVRATAPYATTSANSASATGTTS